MAAIGLGSALLASVVTKFCSWVSRDMLPNVMPEMCCEPRMKPLYPGILLFGTLRWPGDRILWVGVFVR